MKTVFIADVHGNLEALRAVADSIAGERADRVVFLGDIVGYGANPNECIEELRALTCHAVAGNHDLVAATGQSCDDFNPVARQALEWTRAQLTRENRAFLAGFPLHLEIDAALSVHASPRDPGRWPYILNVYDAEEAFAAFRGQVCFFGHSHRPVVFIERADKVVTPSDCLKVALLPGCRYLINCGSVGQPRDGDPRACYGVFDSAAGLFRLERVAYDVAAAREKILQAGLPPFLAERIVVGR